MLPYDDMKQDIYQIKLLIANIISFAFVIEQQNHSRCFRTFDIYCTSTGYDWLSNESKIKSWSSYSMC